jgi:hypothetical protein
VGRVRVPRADELGELAGDGEDDDRGVDVRRAAAKNRPPGLPPTPRRRPRPGAAPAAKAYLERVLLLLSPLPYGSAAVASTSAKKRNLWLNPFDDGLDEDFNYQGRRRTRGRIPPSTRIAGTKWWPWSGMRGARERDGGKRSIQRKEDGEATRKGGRGKKNKGRGKKVKEKKENKKLTFQKYIRSKSSMIMFLVYFNIFRNTY